MSEKILVPVLGESISEATVSKWLKNEGDAVEADEPIVELETDKVNLEVPSPISGTLEKINSKDGSVVEVGSQLGLVVANDKSSSKDNDLIDVKPEIEEDNIIKLETQKKDPEIFEQKEEQSSEDEPLILTEEVSETVETKNDKTNQTLSPAVRKIVSEQKIDIESVKGSGKDGRLTKGDVLGFLESNASTVSSASVIPSTSQEPETSESKIDNVREERVPMSRLRRVIAQRLKEAQNTAAMLTTFNEVDMTAIFEIRKKYKEQFKEKYGVGLGFMSFFTKSVTTALQEFKDVNAMIDGNEVIHHNYADIGIAVSAPKGLMVPVVRNAELMNFQEVESEIKRLAVKAREGKITINEMLGGTFTITNGGVFGSMLSTPIINPPQSAILGMHNIVERPIAIDGKVEIRPIMYVALSYDHRIIDGRESVGFLVRVKECLENPVEHLMGGDDKGYLGL
mgnify:CR=1 FL=1